MPDTKFQKMAKKCIFLHFSGSRTPQKPHFDPFFGQNSPIFAPGGDTPFFGAGGGSPDPPVTPPHPGPPGPSELESGSSEGISPCEMLQKLNNLILFNFFLDEVIIT